MRATVRASLWLAVLAGAAGCPRPPEVEPVHRSLLGLAERAEWSGGPGAVFERPPRVLHVERGVATIEVAFAADGGRLVDTLDTPHGEFPMRRWDLPLERAPDVLAGAEEPLLAGLDVPRLADPSLAIEAERGFYYAGPDLEGAPCLLVAVPAGTRLPGTLLLRYAVEAARLIGSPVAVDLPAADVVHGRRAEGERTREAWVLPTGARLRVPLPAHGEARFRARLATGPAAGGRTVRLSIGEEPPLERAFLAAGGAVEIDVRLPAERRETWVELAARGAEGSLVYLEEPRLERPRTEGDPPNVCLVVVDTLRADRLGPDLMPRLSALAEESLFFADCWSTCSWTLPAVATMLTSNHGGQHQAWLNDQPLPGGIDTLAEVFRRRGYRTAAFTGGVFVDQVYGLDRGFSTFDSSAGGVAAVTERALEWLEGAGEGPWFLLVHTYQVHAPYRPPEEALDAVLERHAGALGAEVAALRAGELQPEPQAFHDERGVVRGDPEDVAALLADLYDEGVRHTDHVLGEFVDELEERDLLDELVLAVTSDHGEEFGEHGMLGHTDTLYREQLHVPLFVRFPGGARPGVDTRAVSHLDLAPTLLDAAGLPPDAPTFEGVSLLGSAGPSPVYATRNIAEVGVLRALREGPWTFVDGAYIYPRGAGGPELYDLGEDPAQQRNVYDPSAGPWPERLEGMSERFDEPKARAVKISSDQVMLELKAMGYVDAPGGGR